VADPAIGCTSPIGRNRSQLEAETDFSFGQIVSKTVASNDVADGVFIVRSGRAEISTRGWPERQVGVARRGDATGGHRCARVSARCRDAHGGTSTCSKSGV
jgi:hypothetical protein